jgi:GDPmannose 4,6-dehydratase
MQNSVRQFVERAAGELGITVEFSGDGEAETGVVVRVDEVAGLPRAQCSPGDVIVRVDPRYYRPTEVETLLGDPSKARDQLGWTPKTTFAELVREMVLADLSAARRDDLVKQAGFPTYDFHE